MQSRGDGVAGDRIIEVVGQGVEHGVVTPHQFAQPNGLLGVEPGRDESLVLLVLQKNGEASRFQISEGDALNR